MHQVESKNVDKSHKVWNRWGLFIIIFVMETIYGIYLGYFKNVLLGDSVSRTANAFYVLYCKPYRLTSMGLIWNPLPSILQLPFILASKLWRPIATKGIGAAIVSALFAAWQGKVLLDTFKAFKIERLFSLLITGLFCFNPYIFFYGANGMSEMMASAFIIKIVCSLVLWMKEGKGSQLIEIGIGFVGMFLTRYESIPFSVAVCLAMCLHIFFQKKEKRGCLDRKKELFYYMEATMWVTFLPMIYTVLVWLFYNWMITGDPLYFMDSGYSISAYANYYSGYGGYTGALIYVWQRSWPFFMLIGGVLLVRFFSKRFLKIDTLIFLILALGNILFIYDRIAKNLSAGYVRYFCYPFIVAIAWLPYELSEMKGIRRRFSVGIVSGTLALTMIFFAWAFQYSEMMREDTLLMVPGNSGEVADYINSNLKNEKILMDSYRTYYVVMNINNINNVVTSCNPDFKESVKDPEGNGIDYLVVPEKGSYGNMDALNRAYPKLYQNGADWCREVASIGEFKIYKVLK